MGLRRPKKLILLGAWTSIMRCLELSLGEWAGITSSHWRAAAGLGRCILNPRDTEGPQMWKESMRKPEDNPLQEEWGRSWNGAEPALTLGIEMPGWMIAPASCRQEKWLRVFLMAKATLSICFVICKLWHVCVTRHTHTHTQKFCLVLSYSFIFQ